jgi:hypothetical protein
MISPTTKTTSFLPLSAGDPAGGPRVGSILTTLALLLSKESTRSQKQVGYSYTSLMKGEVDIAGKTPGWETWCASTTPRQNNILLQAASPLRLINQHEAVEDEMLGWESTRPAYGKQIVHRIS